jgi:hypothetical protein
MRNAATRPYRCAGVGRLAAGRRLGQSKTSLFEVKNFGKILSPKNTQLDFPTFRNVSNGCLDFDFDVFGSAKIFEFLGHFGKVVNFWDGTRLFGSGRPGEGPGPS